MGEDTVMRGKHGKAGKNPRMGLSLPKDLNTEITKAATKLGQIPTAWVRDRLLGIPAVPMPESFVFPQVAAALGQLKALRRELDVRWHTLREQPHIDQEQLNTWVTTLETKLDSLRIALAPPDDDLSGEIG